MTVGATAGGRGGKLLVDCAYAELFDRIVTLRIAPGTAIKSEHLGNAPEMGRASVRAALARLAHEHLVIVVPGRGTFASPINLGDLTHISDVRGRLEGHAAQRAAERVTPAIRSDLDDLLQEVGRGAATADPRTLLELDARVHRFIYSGAGNRYLEQTLELYLNLARRVWHALLNRLPSLSIRVHDHGDVLQAVACGNAQHARTLLTHHVTTFATDVSTTLAPSAAVTNQPRRPPSVTAMGAVATRRPAPHRAARTARTVTSTKVKHRWRSADLTPATATTRADVRRT